MNKRILPLKKLFPVFLALLMIAATLSFSASAVSINSGLNALASQFQKGCGPIINGYSIDYSFFSPVKGKNDTVKYPIVVFTGGTGQNDYYDAEVKENNFPYWSSDEYQARFRDSGGAYIIMARAPQTTEWNMGILYEPLKAALDDFISQNQENVDTTRIYLGGWCYGGRAVWKMAATYPNFFAAIMPMSSFYAPSNSELAVLKNMPVWMMACKADRLSAYAIYNGPTWNNLKRLTNDPAKIRLTRFDTYESPNNTNHNVWYTASSDMFYNRNNTGMITLDGKGKEIILNTPEEDGMIQWISQWHSNYHNENCGCNCHKTGLVKFIWKIQVLFWRIFGMGSQKTCECGISHW